MPLQITHSTSWISMSSSMKWTEIGPAAPEDYGTGFRYQGRNIMNLCWPLVSRSKDQFGPRMSFILGRVSKMYQLSSQLISQNYFRDTIFSQAPQLPFSITDFRHSSASLPGPAWFYPTQLHNSYFLFVLCFHSLTTYSSKSILFSTPIIPHSGLLLNSCF